MKHFCTGHSHTVHHIINSRWSDRVSFITSQHEIFLHSNGIETGDKYINVTWNMWNVFVFFYIGEWKAKLAVRWSTQCSWNKDMLSYYCLNGIASSFVRTETALDWKTTTILGTEIRQKKKLSKSTTFTRKVKMTSMVAKNIELKIRLTIIRSWFTCLSSHCKASSDYLVTQNQFKLTGRGRE